MANHKSAIKRIRQNTKENLKNRARTHRVKSFLSKFEEAISNKSKDDIVTTLRNVQSELMVAVNKGVFAKTTVSRKISRLTKRAKAIID